MRRSASNKSQISFTKPELNSILAVYSYHVSKGSCRDYAIDFLRDMAVFSIFRHAHEQPVASIVKVPGNTASGFIYEIFFDRKRLSRTHLLGPALEPLRDILH